MDWYVIEYLYPESFKRFTEVMFPNIGILSISTLVFYDIKKLYQFFDENGIYLITEMYLTTKWGYTISLRNGTVFGQCQSKSTREEIEEIGFLECFKLLDKKIRCTV